MSNHDSIMKDLEKAVDNEHLEASIVVAVADDSDGDAGVFIKGKIDDLLAMAYMVISSIAEDANVNVDDVIDVFGKMKN